MAVEVNLDAARRLIEALEQSRTPQGEGLVGDGRSPVPAQLAQAFRELMQPPEAAPVGGVDRIQSAFPTEGAQSAQRSAFSGTSDLAADAVGSAAPAQSALPAPADLIGMQFSVNMQLFEGRTHAAVRDGVAERADEVLRSTS